MRISDIFESATLKCFLLRIDYKDNHDVSQKLLNPTHAKIADSSKVGPSFATKVDPYLEAIIQPPVAGGTQKQTCHCRISPASTQRAHGTSCL